MLLTVILGEPLKAEPDAPTTDSPPATRSFKIDEPRWVTFTPDGEGLACLLPRDDHFCVLDLETGTLGEPILEAPAGSFAFSPDGKQVATAGGAKVIVWDVATGEPIQEYGTVVHASPVFSPDGERLYLARSDHIVSIWDLPSNQIVARLQNSVAYQHLLALSADGKRLASTGAGEIIVWDTTSFERTHVIKVNGGGHSIAFRPGVDELLLAGSGSLPEPTGGWEPAVWGWDLQEDEATIYRDFPGESPRGPIAFVVLPEGDTALVSFRNIILHAIDLSTGKEKATFVEPQTRTRPLSLSPDGKQVAAWSGQWVSVYSTEELLKREPMTAEEIEQKIDQLRGRPSRPMQRVP